MDIKKPYLYDIPTDKHYTDAGIHPVAHRIVNNK